MPHATPSPPANQDQLQVFLRKVLVVALLAVILFVVYTVLKLAFEVFLVFFAAVLFGILLHGLSSFLHRHLKLPYKWSLGVVCLLLVAAIVGFSMYLGPSLSQQGEELRRSLPATLEKLKGHIASLPYGEQLLKQISSPEKLLQSQGSAMKNAFSVFYSTFGALANILIVLVIGIYLAVSPQETADGLVRLVPKPRRTRAREVIHVLRYTLWGWLKGTLLAMAVIGTLTTIGLWIIGVPLPLLLGVFAGLMEFIPNLGPFIAGLPAVALALVQDPGKALTVVLFFVALQSVEGYILTPLVQKRIIDLPPILTIIGQVVLGLIAGPWGLLLAVPMVAVIMVLVKMLYIEDVLGDHDVEVKGEDEAIAKEEHQSAGQENRPTGAGA
ncbi:AI-2E family transporter [Rufibacter sediminis]|uniref:AI-2E family transporter n=1 Tax=Rufibacter sediminis TaxID=2762756 RepID=A0ABR6VLZ8_9BACT|nr:AI-2E family transporter [Rufibacter sediminis]MBC3538246.1 AI-2E family transporter [Rufibacter sediminis]